jgi:hypothetical protein
VDEKEGNPTGRRGVMMIFTFGFLFGVACTMFLQWLAKDINKYG